MKRFKKYFKSNTVFFGGILLVLGAIQEYLPQLAGVLPEKYFGLATFFIGVVVIVLRAMTTMSLSEKVKQ